MPSSPNRLHCLISRGFHAAGRALFIDALTRALHGAGEIGGRAFFVEAKDEDAEAFYRKFGVESSPTNPRRLFLLFKDARKTLGIRD